MRMPEHASATLSWFGTPFTNTVSTLPLRSTSTPVIASSACAPTADQSCRRSVTSCRSRSLTDCPKTIQYPIGNSRMRVTRVPAISSARPSSVMPTDTPRAL